MSRAAEPAGAAPNTWLHQPAATAFALFSTEAAAASESQALGGIPLLRRAREFDADQSAHERTTCGRVSRTARSRAMAKWKVPEGMACQVHAFDAREGGALRISLTYDAPTGTGKTTAHTATYHGLVKPVPNEMIVEVDEFETEDPMLRGEMTITITLTDAGGGTDLRVVDAGLPPGVAPADNADNEVGWQMALEKLAAIVEIGGHASGRRPRRPAG